MLVDFRHKPTDDDVLMYNYLKYYDIPVTIIATKCDKVSKNYHDKNLKIIRDTLNLNNDDEIIMFSALSSEGRTSILDIINNNITK